MLKLKKILWLDSIIFLAAFLLFQIELIIAKIFLPKFGGSYLVWGACVVFFQCALLLGYLYSHYVVKKFGLFRYRSFHLFLVCLPLLFFPARSLPAIHPEYPIPLVINIFWQLLISIGPVFFVLSTTSIILQSWLADSQLPQRSNPYALYAVSNLGSFAALLSYPFLFERIFDLDIQLLIWRGFYLILVGLHLAAFKFIKVPPKDIAINKEEKVIPIAISDKLRWFLLSAGTTIMFLSVTNIITYEVAPIPLLWVMPLSLYLLSFVLNFKKKPFCPPWIREKFHVIVGFSMLLFFITQTRRIPFSLQVIVYLVFLFIICMFCNNELKNRKPADSRNLTVFYLVISLGGFIGGMLITWIIPLISTEMVEYFVGLFVISLALIVGEKRLHFNFYALRLLIYGICLIVLWPMIFNIYNFWGYLVLFGIFMYIYSEFKTRSQVFSLSILVILCIMPPVVSLWDRHQYIYKHRNYYGIYKIYEGNEKRFFLNGTTLHGAQYILEKRDTEPLTYYHPSTPIGKFLKSGLFNYQRIGVIGLGAGSLAAYNKEDQAMDFFELDPEVFTIAKKYFAFLNKSHGKINIVFGDARLTLDKVPQNYYDVLIVDAFSGDAVPVHLLTTEAISEYRKHLTEKGVIVFHISNRYLDLSPVLFSNAIALHSYVCRGYNRGFALGAYPSFWVALTWDSGNFEKLTSELKWSKSAKYGTEWLWTDQYSNIISTFKFDSLVSQIKEFQPFYWNFNFDQAAMDEWEYYLAQGDSYSSKGDFKEAINYYHKAVAIKQDRPQPYIGLGRVYENLNRYQEAKASYQKAIDIDSDIADVYFYLGKTCTELGQYQEAMVNYKKAIAINYEYYDAYYNLGVVYICLGQYAEATKILQKVIKLNPDSCFSKSLHDILVLRKEEFINHQKAIETNSTNAQAYFSLGKIYAELGIYRQAITNYEKAISINPDYAEAYSELGAIYAVINKHPEAKDYLIKAKEMFERRKDTEKSKEIGELIEKIL